MNPTTFVDLFDSIHVLCSICKYLDDVRFVCNLSDLSVGISRRCLSQLGSYKSSSNISDERYYTKYSNRFPLLNVLFAEFIGSRGGSYLQQGVVR